MHQKYETYNKIKQTYNVSPETLRNWARNDQIKYKCIQNATKKTWLYDINSIGEFLQQNTNSIQTQETQKGLRGSPVIYIRVSSTKQSDDLERQRQLLSTAFPNTHIISDIGSGLNFHRHGLTSLVQGICRDQYSQVVVTYKDRIARFGYELFELLCKEHGCNILVYGNGISSEQHNDEEDLKDDLLAIVNIFVASHNGKRAQALKKERKRLTELQHSQEINGIKETTTRSPQNQIISKSPTKTKTQLII
jgi:putative resolvase